MMETTRTGEKDKSKEPVPLPGLLAVSATRESRVLKVGNKATPNEFASRCLRSLKPAPAFHYSCRWTPNSASNDSLIFLTPSDQYLGIASQHNLWVVGSNTQSATDVIFWLGDSVADEFGTVDSFDFSFDSTMVCYAVNKSNLRVKSLAGDLIFQAGVC